LIVLLLGADPFAEKLRPYFEQQRRKPRLQGPQRTIHRFAMMSNSKLSRFRVFGQVLSVPC